MARKLWVGRKEAWLCTALLMCCLSLVDLSAVSLSPGSIGAALLSKSKIPEMSSDYREVMKLCAQAKVEDKEMTEEEMQEALNEVNEALLQEGDGPDDMEDDAWMNAMPDPPDTYMTVDNPAKAFGLPSRRELRKGEGKPQMISRTMEKLRKLNKLAELRPDRLIRRWAWKIRVAVAEAEDSTLDRLGILVEKALPFVIMLCHFPFLAKYTRENDPDQVDYSKEEQFSGVQQGGGLVPR